MLEVWGSGVLEIRRELAEFSYQFYLISYGSEKESQLEAMLGIESVQSRCVWASQEYCVSRISKSSFHGKLSWRRGLVLDKIGKKTGTPLDCFWIFSGLWFIPIFCADFWRYHCVIHNDNVTSKLQSEFHGYTFILMQIMPKII